MALARLREKFPDAVLMLGVVVVTGCVAMGPPRPVEVSLDRSTLDVRLSGGALCTGPVTAAPASSGRIAVSGAGRLQDCPAPFDYVVTGETATNPLRIALEEVFTAIGLPDAVAPRATVVLTSPDGRSWTFAAPAS